MDEESFLSPFGLYPQQISLKKKKKDMFMILIEFDSSGVNLLSCQSHFEILCFYAPFVKYSVSVANKLRD